MHNFDGRYLQVIERAGRGCKISAGSICKSWKEQVEDAKFLRGVSASHGKSRLRMQNFCGEYLQGIENVGCRCKICEGSILKSKKSKLQMHWSQKEHLQQRISRYCRYIRHQKSKSPHRSAYFNHGTPQSKKRLCNPVNWSRACPTKLSRIA